LGDTLFPPFWCSNGEAREGDLIVITYEQKILTNTNNNPNEYHRLSFCIFPLWKRGIKGDLIIVFLSLEKGGEEGFNNSFPLFGKGR